MKTGMIGRLILITFFVLGLCSFAWSGSGTGAVVYVDCDAGGTNSGFRWEDAYTSLPHALDVVTGGYEIRVAQGTYRPNDGVVSVPELDERELTFQLKNGVVVKGGYAGLGEPDPYARDIELYETILSGDLNGDDGGDFTNYCENSYHVVTASDIDASAVLDGFTISGGNADDSSLLNSHGGGMYCSSEATIRNCTFTENFGVYGGGMACRPTNCCVTYPTLDNCTFIGNSAEDGGGMFNSDSDPALTNCVFIGNTASNDGGAVMYYMDSVPTLNNCLFSGNHAAHDGGGIYLLFAFNIAITNSTFGYNCAGNLGGGIYQSDASTTPQINNCILWGNSSSGADEGAQVHLSYGGSWADYSCIQGWTGSGGGTGNHGDDPLFVYAENGNFHLKSQAGRWAVESQSWIRDEVTSRCIDGGSMVSPVGFEPFANGGIVNMGFYGGTIEASKSYFGTEPCEIIIAGDINGDCIVDLADFAIMAFHWLESYAQ